MYLEGTVSGGVVVFDNGSAPPDGTRVAVVARQQPSSEPVAPPEPTTEPDDYEYPDDVDVEKDVYFPMPLKWEVVDPARIIDGGRLKPTLILPEDLPDD